MIVQVCPRGAGGVRDYAECLARSWALRGVDTPLIVGTPECLRERLESLIEADDAGRLCVVLHFSGYGYAPRGLCAWLVDTLTSFKSAHGANVRLVVVFHELFATGMPWRSAFWLAPWQSQVARRLARLADSLWTNTAHHAAWLREAAGAATPLLVRAVFSNVGEPAESAAWERRAPRAVVFGAAATRQRAFAALRAHAPALERLGILEIVEAGDGASQAGEEFSTPTRHLGRLSAAELGFLLADSRFGQLDYPARYLGKSSVFAAYAAHGCTVVNTFGQDADADGLRAGVDYVNLRLPVEADAPTLAQMARRLNRWYGGHSLALQSRELLGVIRGEQTIVAPPA